MTMLDARVGIREYLGYWAGTLPVRVLGAAALAMAWRPWSTVSGAPDAVLFGCAVACAVWAAPSLDRRPSLESARWSYRLLRHRTTVLAGGVVFAAASSGDTAWWEGACVVGLLVAYLVTSETWPWRWGRGARRVWAEAVAACVGAGVVLVAAEVPVSGAGGGLGRVIAAAVVGLAAVGGVVLCTRWRGRNAGAAGPR
ncbi:hypothetical protein ACFUAC_05855 [Streptomyces sp. NPDC057148]|uniref:hypothetical protein n=1 Tax=unclassified Streptomyces TaxID=2593676 RepID=UPI00362E795E